MSRAAPRAWQRMLSGRRLDLLDPSPLDVEIEDIAHGLARVARWNGQTKGPHIFSVAQHSLVVEAIASALDLGIGPRGAMFALLHDAPEYVVGDMISPFKAVIGDSYKDVEIIDTGSDLLSIKPKLKENLTMSKKALNDIYNQENTPKYQSIKSKIQDRKNK